MTQLYYFFVLLNAAVALVAAVVAYWRNRSQSVGPLFGVAMFSFGMWLVGFAQYFRPMGPEAAMRWAVFTLSTGILNSSVFLHAFCALVGKARRLRWWIACSYLTAAVFIGLLWAGKLVVGLKAIPNMDHYLRYNRALYPLLGLHIAGWQWFGVFVLIWSARQATGYKRTQLFYFLVTWFIAFLAGNSVILPLEYDVYIIPFGFFVLPLSLALLAYALGKARLADFNVVIGRLLIHTVTLMVVVLLSMVFVWGMILAAPGFMNPAQITFAISVTVFIGLTLAVMLPRFLPRAERLMQERMLGKRYGYQDTLAGLVKELGHFANVDQVLATVATRIHSEMQVARTLILIEDSLTGKYQILAESGLSSEERANLIEVVPDSVIVRWLQRANDTLVLDELPRRTDEQTLQSLTVELEQLQVVVCVPMVLEKQLIGMLCLGAKTNHDMFYVSDINLLETLAAEVALALKYQQMEEQIARKNKLVELGTIAAGVAHEIRNPLASIRTFAQLLPEKIGDPEFQHEFSKLVLKDVERITKVIESMLAFARPAQITIAEHPAVEVADEAILLMASRLKSKSIELTRQYHEQPVLRVDKQQIAQVLVNLINNAIDALPEHGQIRVTIGTRLLESTANHDHRQRHAVIEVADNGPGIPTAVRSRLFDPFFTTKKEGTGLGLSISQKIVRDHGGIITVSSIEGKGTNFQVNLPLI